MTFRAEWGKPQARHDQRALKPDNTRGDDVYLDSAVKPADANSIIVLLRMCSAHHHRTWPAKTPLTALNLLNLVLHWFAANN
jgi:hypothetical protein